MRIGRLFGCARPMKFFIQHAPPVCRAPKSFFPRQTRASFAVPQQPPPPSPPHHTTGTFAPPRIGHVHCHSPLLCEDVCFLFVHGDVLLQRSRAKTWHPCVLTCQPRNRSWRLHAHKWETYTTLVKYLLLEKATVHMGINDLARLMASQVRAQNVPAANLEPLLPGFAWYTDCPCRTPYSYTLLNQEWPSQYM